MRVHWSSKALTQLSDLITGLRQYSEAAAERVEDELIAASLRLGNFPQLGRVVPESKLLAVRELFVGKYRLVYMAGDFTIEIISVLHQAQQR